MRLRYYSHGRVLRHTTVVSTSSVAQASAAQFQAELERIAQSARCAVGAQAIDLSDGATFGVKADSVFPQYSAIKIPILIELFRRADAEPGLLSRRVRVNTANRTGGSGILCAFSDNSSELSLNDLAVLMIALSDNTATNILIDKLDMNAINHTIAALGHARTRLQRKMIRPEASARDEENLSTPAEAAALMQQMARGELPLSAPAAARVRAILEIDKPDPARDPLPVDVRVAFKPGGGPGARTAWAWVDLPGRPYAFAAMAAFTRDDAEGGSVIRAISAACYDYFSRRARANSFGVRAQ